MQIYPTEKSKFLLIQIILKLKSFFSKCRRLFAYRLLICSYTPTIFAFQNSTNKLYSIAVLKNIAKQVQNVLQ